MASKVGIAVIVGIAIIVGVIVIQLDDMSWKKSTTEEYYDSIGKANIAHVVYPDNPQILGPLQINKDKYLLGENVYVILTGLMPMDKGAVLFYTPGGVLYDEWEFNGDERDFQKKYFKPQLLKSKNICEKEKLIGEWTVMFKGYDEAKIHFEVTPNILPGMENHFLGCNVAYEIDLKNP